jgi:hypothetical protein
MGSIARYHEDADHPPREPWTWTDEQREFSQHLGWVPGVMHTMPAAGAVKEGRVNTSTNDANRPAHRLRPPASHPFRTRAERCHMYIVGLRHASRLLPGYTDNRITLTSPFSLPRTPTACLSCHKKKTKCDDVLLCRKWSVHLFFTNSFYVPPLVR